MLLRYKYASLIRVIDDELITQKQKKVHFYTIRKMKVTEELKEVLIAEYKPHWDEVKFTRNKMMLVTKEDYEILPYSEVNKIPAIKSDTTGWPFLEYACFNFGTSNGKKAAKS